MKSAMRITVILLAAFMLSGCSANEAAKDSVQSIPSPNAPASSYQKISADEAYQIMTDTTGYLILDVRTKEEFDQGYIENAILLPVTDIAQKAGEQLTDKEQVILVYCRSGRRSAQAAQLLMDMGYTNIYDFGGIIDWPHGTVTK